MSDFNVDDVVYTVREGAKRATSGASKIYRDVAGRGEAFAQKMKLNYTLGRVKDAIDEAYRDLGEYVFDEFAGEDIEGPIKDKCSHITKLYREYKSISDELCELKNAKICPRCGELNDKNKNFCGECGAPLN